MIILFFHINAKGVGKDSRIKTISHTMRKTIVNIEILFAHFVRRQFNEP